MTWGAVIRGHMRWGEMRRGAGRRGEVIRPDEVGEVRGGEAR